MKRRWIFAGVLASIGLFVAFFGLLLLEFDFTKLDRMQYEKRVYEITEEFDTVDMKMATFDIVDMKMATIDVRFALSEDGVCRVECMEAERLGYTVAVKDGTLTVAVRDDRKWHDHINIVNISHPVTVYLPKTQYDRLSIDMSTGDVEIPDGFAFETVSLRGSTGDVSIGRVRVGSMYIEVSTGDVTLTGVRAKALQIEATTGEVSLTDVQTAERLAIETSTGDVNLTDVLSDGTLTVVCSTGDVHFTRCDAASIRVDVSTGHIKGTLRSGKDFSANSSTGDVNVPPDSDGGTCDLSTSTGDIIITIS